MGIEEFKPLASELLGGLFRMILFLIIMYASVLLAFWISR